MIRRLEFLGRWARRLGWWARRQAAPIRWLAFLVLSGAGLAAVWWLPKLEVDPWRASLAAVDELTAEDAVRRTLVQVVGGAFFLVGLYLTWQNVIINREGKITDRFSKAIDQLGSDQLDVRLGGIYALERIDRDSERDHWTIVEVLCAFIRERTREPSPQEEPLPGIRVLFGERAPRTDVQAACTVLGRRSWRHNEGGSLDLSRAHLEGASLRGVHWERALLFRTHLEKASLLEAHLEQAVLVGARLEGANLRQAHMEEARLDSAHLEHARLVEAHMEGADLGDAHLEGARLIGAHMEGAGLIGTHLEGASLLKAQGLAPEQVREAVVDAKTSLPPDIAAALITGGSAPGSPGATRPSGDAPSK